jgi:hypothetical protein
VGKGSGKAVCCCAAGALTISARRPPFFFRFSQIQVVPSAFSSN